MVNKYQKGDAYSNEKELLTPEQIIEHGKAYEELIRNNGWKLLNIWIEKQINLQRDRLIDIRMVKTFDEVNDIRILIMAYKWIISKPKEMVDKKNKLLEEIKKRRDK